MIFRKKKKEEEIEEEDLPAGRQGSSKKKNKKDEGDELVWDKKRIVIGIVVLLFIIFAAREVKGMFFPNTNILGESTTISLDDIESPDVESSGVSLQSQIDKSLDQVKDSVNNIDPDEVATSSPQIQKVLKDIQSIRNLPTDKAKDACYNICSNL